ncbi:MAG: glycoside hydrolase family 3 C-terminal domain-containing protein, partial [Bifidobacteriaceae bacterium]|nr:glycoside hydrolase family 3 C-terminal domain-containing protein [Bifidobacteriaceae bacterium]
MSRFSRLSSVLRRTVTTVTAASLTGAMLVAVVPTPASAALYPGVVGLSRRAAAEGVVMLRNDNAVLPLDSSRTVSVFGRVQVNYFLVGYGSGGDVNYPSSTNLLTGMRRNPNITVNESLARVYESWCAANPPNDGSWGNWPTSYPEMPLTDAQVEAAADASDTAVVVIGRSAGEDRESTDTAGSWRLTNDERSMLQKVNAEFDKIVVLLNVGNLIDLSWLGDYPNIDSLLYVWQGGMESGSAVSDILSGDESPSGKLPQTVANTLADYPSRANFGSSAYTNYAEDIFVGYRYFETFAPGDVMYPFGFGMSYSTFSLSTPVVTESAGQISVQVRVTNTGQTRGKEVVQVYYGAPQGLLGKAAKSLAAYAKTNPLAPGASEDLTLTFNINDMASYDDGGYTGNDSAWVLEAGDYPVYVGTSVANSTLAGSHNEASLRVVEQMTEAVAPRSAFNRWHATPGGAGLTLETNQAVPLQQRNLKADITAEMPVKSPDMPFDMGSAGIQLIDVYNGTDTMTDFMAQLSLTSLANLVRGAGGMSHSAGIGGNASVYGGTNATLRGFGIPPMSTTDGPSGVRMSATATLLPIGTALAATWNLKLVEDLYAGVGAEMVMNGSDALLAPGMNLQRDPLCGRNFEYFSEDPLITGTMGAATVRGVQSQGVSATPKHFAANNQETNRHNNDSRISERALREIYLKPFEITIKTAQPQNIMMSYNKVNGSWAHYNYELATTVLRDQWGFDGVVMTDWWITRGSCPDISLTSTSLADNACRVRAGVDVLMPGDREGEGPPQTAYNNGLMTIGEIQRSAKTVLEFAMKSARFRQDNNLPLFDYQPPAPIFTVSQPVQGPPPQVDGIWLNGELLDGFSPLTTEYTLYAKQITTFPLVTAQAADGIDLTITQGTAASPFATILATAADGAQARYRVYWSDDPSLPLPPGATPARMTGVKINGVDFLPFYQDIYAYTLPVTSAGAVIEPITPPGITAHVTGPVASVYTVRVESADHARDYTFTFTGDSIQPPQSDEFDAGPLSSFWTVGNPTNNFQKVDGAVKITTEDGEWYQTGTNQHNYVWQHAQGDWTSITQMTYDVRPYQSYHQLGVQVFGDENNFLQFMVEYNNWNGQQPDPLKFSVKNETNATNTATSYVPSSLPATNGVVTFRVNKTGNAYTFAVSMDGGTTWTSVGGTFTKALAEPKFSLLALHAGNGLTTEPNNGPPLVPITATYDFVRFTTVPPSMPTAPVTAVTATGITRLKLATEQFHMTSPLQTENCSSPCVGRNVGYTEAGAYLLYNLDVAQAGYYQVVPQIAANPSSGAAQLAFSLDVDGERATTFNRAGGTGGWQNWVRMPAQLVYLPQGLVKLRFYLDTGSWNLDYLEFEADPLDRSHLRAAVLHGQTLHATHYLPLSWAPFAMALATAQSVLVDPTVSPLMIRTAFESLLQTTNALAEAPANSTRLEVAIANAAARDGDDYTQSTWQRVATALQAATDLLATNPMGPSGQAAVDAATTELNGGIVGLILRGDLSAATALLDAVTFLVESDYTASTWQTLQSAITDAQAVVAK